VQQTFQADPTSLFSKLSTRDYFFDPTSLTLLRVRDLLHPDNDALNGALIHTIDYGNYQTLNGILVPFSVVETIAGQQTWKMQLTSVAFNTGLSDTDFQF
jgi:hypothetical protein